MPPPIAHAANARSGVWTNRATTDGLTKIPAPMMPPITIIVASNTPRRRAREGSLSVEEVNLSVDAIDLQFASPGRETFQSIQHSKSWVPQKMAGRGAILWPGATSLVQPQLS